MEKTQGNRAVAFLFPGLGDQYVGMARGLYDSQSVFHDCVDRCSEYLITRLGCDLREVLYGGNSQVKESGRESTGREGIDLRAMLGRSRGWRSSATQQLKQTELAQPAVFIVEYALAQLLIQRGIRPHSMIGHSLGEYVAACLAGVVSLEDALLLVCKRAQLIQHLPRGGMLAVGLSEAEVQPLLRPGVSLGAVNGERSCVLSGDIGELEDLSDELERQGEASFPVETTHAFHSSMLEPAEGALKELVKGFTLNPPKIPYLSNLTGTWITAQQATDPSYWGQHMCRTVRFEEGLRELLRDKELVLMEVGPGQSLSSFAKQHKACPPERVGLVLATLRREYDRQSDVAFLSATLRKLQAAGVAVDGEGLHRGECR